MSVRARHVVSRLNIADSLIPERVVLDSIAENVANRTRLGTACMHNIVERRAASNKVRKVRSRASSNLLRHVPDMMFELDANGIYVDFAGPAHDAFAAPHDFLGKSVTQTLPHDLADRTISALQRLREHGGTERMEYALTMSDGLHWYEARMSALPTGGATAYVRDITEQKANDWRLQESEQRLRNIVDSAPALLWITDQIGACVYCNQTWLEFTGRTSEQEYGTGWESSIHPEDVTRCKALLDEHTRSHSPFRVEHRLRRHDGEYRWLLNQAVPRFSSEAQFTGFIGSAVDITDIKEAHERQIAELLERTQCKVTVGA